MGENEREREKEREGEKDGDREREGKERVCKRERSLPVTIRHFCELKI